MNGGAWLSLEGTKVDVLLRDLDAAGIRLRDLDTRQSTLEDIFVNLVRNGR